MTATPTHALPMLLEEVEVRRVDRISPSFVRLELGSPALAELGVDGPWWDQRFKLIVPHAPGAPLPSFEDADAGWYAAWLERPVEERGVMRTYTIREVRGQGADTRIVVDIVLHEDGESGPGAAWAAAARVGDRAVVLAPRRGQQFGGIEFVPGAASRVLLAGDETAVPAITAILAQLPPEAQGAAFLEVPRIGDILSVVHPEGVQIVWLPREGAPLGSRLHLAVLEHLGLAEAAETAVAEVAEDEVDPDLWETPTYSSSGEAVLDPAVLGEADVRDGLYLWIAGESRMVTGLRRALVKDHGFDRRQVAFMGYWRHGVAMKS
ncbi:MULTISPECIES: siderophore-interacting protein [unclassified Nocardioides]|uniref:siderophore-interacting protein n=1 Tax=unclassified Nocardioides TaxID=2615069 RepID=UPI001E28F3FD|nr:MULTISPECIES: siderophore-interacting protein [unclassified Nocardioides]